MSEERTIVICKNCGERKDVSINTCLAKGWPKCCEVTMAVSPLEDAEKFGRAMDSNLKPIAGLLGKLRGR